MIEVGAWINDHTFKFQELSFCSLKISMRFCSKYNEHLPRDFFCYAAFFLMWLKMLWLVNFPIVKLFVVISEPFLEGFRNIEIYPQVNLNPHSL